MATRTLGIKYEIRGFKEASESLKRINLGIRKSLKFDQKLTEQKISNSKKIAAIEIENLEKVQEQELDHLEKFKAQYRRYLDESLRSNDSDIDLDWVYGDILTKVKQYRQRMKTGDLQEALKLAEELLGAIAVAEDLYQQLGSKQQSRKFGQLRRIRGEILSGDRGKGRIDVGLLEIANTEKVKELKLDFEALKKAAVLSGKQLSKFERQLRNTKEQVAGFMENADRALSVQRIETITQGVNQGQGDQLIQVKLDQVSQEDLEKRIKFLQSKIAKVEQDLGSAALAEGLRRVEEATIESGGLNSLTTQRLLDEARDKQEKEAVAAAAQVWELQTQMYQYQEQLAQQLQQTRNTTIDFSRTISDYFFNLEQRIKEAQVETERLIEQIFYQDIKSQLRRAISPGSESFINGIIDGVIILLLQKIM